MRVILRSMLLTAVLVLVPSMQAAAARSATDVADVQAAQGRMEAQLQALAERLDQLEADNAALKGEVAQLNAALGRREAEVETLKAQSQQAGEAAAQAAKDADKFKGAEWASRIKFKGDLRIRSDRLESERVVGSGETATVEDAADRDRMRFRARLAAEAKVTDTTKVGFGLASGDGDPRSSNQTFTNANSTKAVYIDLAYADWSFAPGARLVLGTQAGLVFPWLEGETRAGMHYYDCGACQGNAPFWGGGNAYGNTTLPDGTLKYDYNVLLVEAQVGTTLAGYPLLAWGGWAQNLASGVEYDTAFDLGVSLGRAADPGTWEVALLYHSADKDALFAQLTESDFAAVSGPGYEIGKDLDYDRMQLDVNYRF